ncbi:MAG TPA: class I SAM-dependent methyltransferase [Tepidiformaceae bacterium]|nr:class I SAM-dependent methyltransferase [Tepidiformaceae bacterium]
MSFAVGADAYDRFMGRFSVPLAPLFADFAGIGPGLRALDVGCGPGALTAELVARLSTASVAAVDPSTSFAAAARARFPGADIRLAHAEDIPFESDTFDACLAQLVVHFLADPVAGIREMGRVTRPGGVVAACVWDHEGGGGPLSLFWEAVHHLDPAAEGEAGLPGARDGHLAELFESAGLRHVDQGSLAVNVQFASFDDWWEPFTFGVGPAGAYVSALDQPGQAQLREQCRAMLPGSPFVISGRAWAARGLA